MPSSHDIMKRGENAKKFDINLFTFVLIQVEKCGIFYAR